MTRRARTKTRRPKFLSLRRQLASTPPPPIMSSAAADILMDPDPSVACLLDADAGGSATIADLLGAGGSPPPPPESPSSSSMNWDEADDGRLARRALRGRERWVFCCSSPSTSSSEEVASGGAPPPLSLKLDYDEILAAWSGRGSLYIGGGEGPQVVPELHDAAVFVEVGNVWVVPGDTGDSREARVMRYKEKRRSRLFAKRIRYQVRKLNAEKRPRLKGRFVKKINDA